VRGFWGRVVSTDISEDKEEQGLIRVERLVGLRYEMVKFTDNRKIKQVGAYLDINLWTRAIEETK
jgi:hypothetical protein